MSSAFDFLLVKKTLLTCGLYGGPLCTETLFLVCVSLRKMTWNMTKSAGCVSKGQVCWLIRFDWSGLSNHIIRQKHCRCSLGKIIHTHTHARIHNSQRAVVGQSKSISVSLTFSASDSPSGNCWQFWRSHFTERTEEITQMYKQSWCSSGSVRAHAIFITCLDPKVWKPFFFKLTHLRFKDSNLCCLNVV